MAIRRVALIFDTILRPETAGVYCHRALERSSRSNISSRMSWTRTPAGIRSLPEHRRWPAVSPSARAAALCLLGHRYPPRFRPVPREGAALRVVFAAQRDGVDLLRGIGVSSATWLPLACDPEIHRKHDVAKQYDVAFVGNIFPARAANCWASSSGDIAIRSSASATSMKWPGRTRRPASRSTAASATTSTCECSRRLPAARCS